MNQVNWTLERDRTGIAWLTLYHPGASTNVLSREVLLELDEILIGLGAAPPRGLLLLSGKPGGFIDGADIKEFSSLDSPELAFDLIRSAQRVLDRMESMPCPTVAAIAGFALGGGLELALACRRRGVQNTVARLQELSRLHGPIFTPDPGWEMLLAKS